MDKPCLAAASNCNTSLSSDTGAAASMTAGPTVSSSGAVSAFQRRVDSKKNTKKRHSFTALSVTHKSSQAASHRHSMEISAPVLISSSDPRAAARIGELAHLSCAAQVGSHGQDWCPWFIRAQHLQVLAGRQAGGRSGSAFRLTGFPSSLPGFRDALKTWSVCQRCPPLEKVPCWFLRGCIPPLLVIHSAALLHLPYRGVSYVLHVRHSKCTNQWTKLGEYK